MSFNLNSNIPESDLPVKSPSGAARVRYVDGDGKSYSSAMPDVIAASALVQDAIDGVVADASAEIGIVVNGIGYLPPRCVHERAECRFQPVYRHLWRRDVCACCRRYPVHHHRHVQSGAVASDPRGNGC